MIAIKSGLSGFSWPAGILAFTRMETVEKGCE
jgi:hypothetical protein